MNQDEQAFLKELQNSCLKEAEDFLNSFQESLSSLKEAPLESLRDIQKIIHSMKGNLQAVAFLHFAAYIHELETVLSKFEKVMEERTEPVSESDGQVLEFFLSNVLDALFSYSNQLKSSGVDTEEFKVQRQEPLTTLGYWAPSAAPKVEKAPSIEQMLSEEVLLAGTEIPVEVGIGEELHPAAEQMMERVVDQSLKAPLTEKPKPREEESQLFLLFKNCEQYFAIAIEHIVEVIKCQPLSAPPQNRSNLAGLLNLRGEVLPVLNIREIMMDSIRDYTYVVISQLQEMRFGFQVEAVYQVVSLDSSTFQPVEGFSDRRNRSSLFCQSDGKTISILKLPELINV